MIVLYTLPETKVASNRSLLFQVAMLVSGRVILMVGVTEMVSPKGIYIYMDHLQLKKLWNQFYQCLQSTRMTELCLPQIPPKGHQYPRLKERGANLFLDLIRIWEHST